MYITAHRVRKSDEEIPGINGFLHIHETGLSVPELSNSRSFEAFLHANPGTLQERYETIKPGGNSVLSYLDILTADTPSIETITTCFEEFKEQLDAPDYPLVRKIDGIVLRFGTSWGLQGAEHLEFDDLSIVILDLLQRVLRAK